MSEKPKILFISHAATRNGATILLLNTLRWLKARDEFEIEILVHGRGELLGEFEAIGRTTVWRSPAGLMGGFPRSIRDVWSPRIETVALKLKTLGRGWDLIYVNTAAVWKDVPVLADKARRLLWHIHEMDYALNLLVGEERGRELFKSPHRFIAVSESVRSVLGKNFGVARERMDVINGSVPFHEQAAQSRAAMRRKILSRLGWPEDSFVVGACGAMGWRKGTDVFLEIAREMSGAESCAKVRFLWVGGGAADDEALRFKKDAELFGLGDNCRSVPTTGDVMDYYGAMDVFALTSREDPYPLVMLEAGAFHVPTVCFEKSGGGPEFVGDDAGLIVPYLDVKAFALQLRKLKDSPEWRAKIGAAAAEKVRTRHVIETQGPKILESIRRCLGAK